MKNKKEEWIEKMMGSVKAPDPDLNSKNAVFDKIIHRINMPEAKNNLVSFKQFRLAGVAAIAVVALNIGVIALAEVRSGANEAIKTTYGLSTINLDLYP